MKLLFTILAAGAVALMAQAPDKDVFFNVPAGPPMPPPGAGLTVAFAGGVGMAPQGASTFQFIAAEPVNFGKAVAGAPYSAEGVTEFTQTLADGTRITRKSTNRVARDSQGRTREERSLGMVGPWASSGDAPVIVTIHDPVAGETYIINEKEKTVQKMKAPGGDMMAKKLEAEEAALGPKMRVRTMVQHTTALPGGPGQGNVMIMGDKVMAEQVMIRQMQDAKPESLGSQTMEGVRVDGTRISHTIPVGEIGNDRAITVTTERWVSPELQVTVRSLTKDPQIGETNYRLTAINRAEPAKALFQIPADYKVEEGPKPMIRMRRELKQ